jgi:hypothetical protein
MELMSNGRLEGWEGGKIGVMGHRRHNAGRATRRHADTRSTLPSPARGSGRGRGQPKKNHCPDTEGGGQVGAFPKDIG